MSTDLELCQELPKVSLQPIRVRTQQGSESADTNGSVIPKQDFKGQEDNGQDSDQCPRTPTSKEHRIPELLTCPPAPRKPKMRAAPCKRKLTELKFFEIVKREEVESFFRSSFEVSGINGSSAKRSCCSCK